MHRTGRRCDGQRRLARIDGNKVLHAGWVAERSRDPLKAALLVIELRACPPEVRHERPSANRPHQSGACSLPSPRPRLDLPRKVFLGGLSFSVWLTPLPLRPRGVNQTEKERRKGWGKNRSREWGKKKEGRNN